jgi:hypothetical protein
MSEIRTVVIDRSKWRTGGGSKHATGQGDTELQNTEGYMCCLGFVCKSHKTKTKGISSPGFVGRKIPLLTSKRDSWEGYENTELSKDAMTINDDYGTTRQEKESKLKKLFKGKLKLVFKGRSVKYKEKK